MELLKLGKKREYYKFGEYPSKSYDKKYLNNFNIFYHDEIAIYVDSEIELEDVNKGILSKETLEDIKRNLIINHYNMSYELYLMLQKHIEAGGDLDECIYKKMKEFKANEENKIKKDKMIQEYQRKIKNLEAINEEQEKNIISDKSSVIKIFIKGVLVGIIIGGIFVYVIKHYLLGGALWVK